MQIEIALIELGILMLALALLGRLAQRFGLPAIPFYLLAGLFFGEGGIIPITEAGPFVDVGASLGVVFLMFVLGLEYSPQELRQSISTNRLSSVIDLVFNATPGVVIGFLLGWGALGAVVLGGITYVSSSGVIAKMLTDLNRLGNRETPTILSILVIEDLVMAVFLPVVAVLLAGDSVIGGVVSGIVSLTIVSAVLLMPSSAGRQVSRVMNTSSSEVLLISLLGVVLLLAGLAEYMHISYAIGAFLVGIILSGQVAERGRTLLEPLRDSFAALFFVSFGLGVNPADLVEFIPLALGLALVSAISKFGSGYLAAKKNGFAAKGRRRAGVTLIARGELSVVLAGIAIAGGINSDIGPVTILFVLILAIGGSVATRFAP
jgi:CPA2 family monovalent cation:H+ antiporter-2